MLCQIILINLKE